MPGEEFISAPRALIKSFSPLCAVNKFFLEKSFHLSQPLLGETSVFLFLMYFLPKINIVGSKDGEGLNDSGIRCYITVHVCAPQRI